jgi:hypothetical protein
VFRRNMRVLAVDPARFLIASTFGQGRRPSSDVMSLTRVNHLNGTEASLKPPSLSSIVAPATMAWLVAARGRRCIYSPVRIYIIRLMAGG